MKSILRKITKLDLYDSIPYDDLMLKQRFALFRIFTFTGFLASTMVAIQILTAFGGSPFIAYLLFGLSGVMLLNYMLVKDYRKLPVAYLITLMAAFLMMHFQSYTSGGIRNSGTMYLAVVLLSAFMMLGTRAGKWFTALVIINFIYLYIITQYTDWTSYAMFGNDAGEINTDFVTTAILAFFLIAAQSSYLHSGKNVIIERITEQKDELEISNRRLQEYTSTLEKTNNELDKFASIVSHDLKAPLRAIGNLADWIEEDGGTSFTPEVRTNFNMIKQRIKRMEDLIQAILDYSKADKRVGDQIQVDTADLIRETVEFIGLPENVKLNLPNNMPSMVTDKTRLSQVFSNLIGNGVKYNDKEVAEITVGVETHENGWTFSVKDNGPGIDPKFHEKVFVIFQTLNRRDDVESTGVGLAIVKKIIEDEGGKIWIESEPGNGADFKFFWPKVKKVKDAALIAAILVV
ncbi:MAG: ATP-binding protein [Bacteroidota bacterium]